MIVSAHGGENSDGFGGGSRRYAIGFDSYTIAHRGLSATETLQFAVTHGFEGVQFVEPAAIDPRLDPGRLAEIRAQAKSNALYLECGLPSPNPFRRQRELGRHVPPVELARELEPHVMAIRSLGCHHARIYFGDRGDRFRADVSWGDQIDAAMEVLQLLAPLLKDAGIQLGIENHADFTVEELLSVLKKLDPAVAGVTLDTGNLLMRFGDPIESTRRLAPWVTATHVKDAVLAFTPTGISWQARPVGAGILPLPDMLAVLLASSANLALSIELHPRTYDCPIFDPKWIGHFPTLTPSDLAAIVRLTVECEERFATGRWQRPDVVEAVPWAERDHDWLASSLGYLRSVVPTVAAIRN
jgi:sugar phosphate isomerase/epimerase